MVLASAQRGAGRAKEARVTLQEYIDARPDDDQAKAMADELDAPLASGQPLRPLTAPARGFSLAGAARACLRRRAGVARLTAERANRASKAESSREAISDGSSEAGGLATLSRKRGLELYGQTSWQASPPKLSLIHISEPPRPY